MTRWLVTGAAGMLGRELVPVLAESGAVTPLDRSELDITDPAAVAEAVTGHDIVVNAAAWTDVDAAESAEEAASAVNGHAVAHLARACADAGARLLQISTDYVLPGDAMTPYPEDAEPAPVNAYGRGKLIGERAVRRLLPETGYVVRTAWLYASHGRNFVTTMRRLATQQDTVSVVTDQLGQPTWTGALARQLRELGEAAVAGAAPAGIYHGTAAGHTSWHGFARAVFAASGHDPDRVLPTTSDAFPRPARRPSYSVLGHGRWATAGVAPQPDWQEQLTAALTGAPAGAFPRNLPRSRPEVDPRAGSGVEPPSAGLPAGTPGPRTAR